MCLCALYNPLIWTEEGKIREQNMNGGMHEKHVKDSFFYYYNYFSVLYSKALIISHHPSGHLRRELSAMELCESG